MATGTPVIASDLPVVRELLENGKTGWLVRPDRPSELARAIRILLAHPGQRVSIGASAREKFSAELTWQKSTQALTEVYQAL